MAQYTQKYNLRYPEPSDNANVPDDIKNLALSVEDALDESVYTKNNFAVVNKTINITTTSRYSEEIEVPYPNGFTYDNCVPISLMAYRTNSDGRTVSFYNPRDDSFSVQVFQEPNVSNFIIECIVDNTGLNKPWTSVTCKIIFMKIMEGK